MLDSLLEREIINSEILQAYFFQALCWSLGAGLLEDGRAKFDRFVKYLGAIPEIDPLTGLASAGMLLCTDEDCDTVFTI